ncbi:MAG: type II toxin-antitoxin system PemK/MazF family toxin [Firmicutes bacterium]|nr:type II toxin-antitoxin system PemK/MazF family toxin [Bacillota bacterium]
MPITTIYDPGSVVLIPFPFTSLNAAKKRPAVVMSRRSYQAATHDIILAAVTSQRHEGPGDVALRHWSEAGLLKPSYLRAGKLVTVHESLILKKLGQLTPDDWYGVLEQLRQVLADEP